MTEFSDLLAESVERWIEWSKVPPMRKRALRVLYAIEHDELHDAYATAVGAGILQSMAVLSTEPREDGAGPIYDHVVQALELAFEDAVQRLFQDASPAEQWTEKDMDRIERGRDARLAQERGA